MKKVNYQPVLIWFFSQVYKIKKGNYKCSKTDQWFRNTFICFLLPCFYFKTFCNMFLSSVKKKNPFNVFTSSYEVKNFVPVPKCKPGPWFPGVPGENHRSVTSHWPTLSHNVVASVPRHKWDSNSQRLWW
jgi:hypothetical protein